MGRIHRQVDAQLAHVVQLGGQPGEVADPVAVPVEERLHVHLVEDARPCTSRSWDVRDLELQAVGVLEEGRVVAGAVLRIVARTAVEDGDGARLQELGVEAVDVGAGAHPERDVIEPGVLAVRGRRRRARAAPA